MSYSLGALADFVQLGPQVYPARPNGVQVIMRGPHGQRLSVDPVRSRQLNPRGSGFNFWVEQLNVPANRAWIPTPKVVGLLGLGADAPDISVLEVCSSGAPPPPNFGPPPSDPSERSMWKALNDDVGAACRGRVDEARRQLAVDWQIRGGALSVTQKANFQPMVIQAQVYMDLAQGGAKQRLAETQAREAAYSGRVRAYDAQVASECSGFDPSCWARKAGGAAGDAAKAAWAPLLGVAALAAGGLAIYALASGYGRGLATKGA